MTGRYSQERYLAAKRTVDDRALDRDVLEAFTRRLDSGVHIVEVGAGIGTMVQRLLEWELLPETVTYTLVDVDEGSIASARERLPAWARERGYRVESASRPDGFRLRRNGSTITVYTVVADATAALEARRPDAVVGSAFVDLLRPTAVEGLLDALPAGCLCYFPITFDGETIFEPGAIPGFDDHVVERYHEDMIRRDHPGDPNAGRHLLERAVSDHTLYAAGGSDWIVTAEDDSYPADETYFLHHVLETIHTALESDPAVDGDVLETWIDRRREQVEAGELVYVAHGLDVVFGVRDS